MDGQTRRRWKRTATVVFENSFSKLQKFLNTKEQKAVTKEDIK